MAVVVGHLHTDPKVGFSQKKMMGQSNRGQKIARTNSVLILKNASPVREALAKTVLVPQEEVKLMESNSEEQCSYGDTFWGVDLERRRMLDNLENMGKEDAMSNDNERQHNLLKMRREWESEHKMAEQQKAYEETLAEQRMRQKYLAAFFANTSSTPIMETIWRPENNNHALQLDVISGAKKTVDSKKEDQTLRVPSFGQTKGLFHDVGFQQARTLEEEGSAFEGDDSNSYLDLGANSFKSTITNAIDYRKLMLQDERKMKKLAEEIMHGHPLYQWDQETLLRESFDALDGDKSGLLTAAKLCKVAKNETVKKYLRYTVFGPFVKRRQWRAFLEVLLKENDSPEYAYADSISLDRFYEVALTLSLETYKPLEKIKTHTEYFTELSSPSENTVYFAEQARSRNSVTERDLRIFKELYAGDVVWSLYKDGSQWLPAVIVQVHDDYTYDLRYPMSQNELRQFRKMADGNKILRGHSSSPKHGEYEKHNGNSAATLLELTLLRNKHGATLKTLVQKAQETEDKNVMEAVGAILGYNL